jgi:hypothetical protein
MSNRNLVGWPTRKYPLKKLAAYGPMQLAYAKGESRAAQRQVRHVEGLIFVSGVDSAQGQEIFHRHSSFIRKSFGGGEIFANECRIEAVESSIERSMGGKYVATAGGPKRFPEGQTGAKHHRAGPLEDRESSVSLVEMAYLKFRMQGIDGAPAGHSNVRSCRKRISLPLA